MTNLTIAVVTLLCFCTCTADSTLKETSLGGPLTDEDFQRGANLTRDELLRRSESGKRSDTRRGSNRRLRFRNGVPDNGSRWPNARIPYQLASQYTQSERALLARSIQAFHDRSCVRFAPRTNERDYVYIGKLDQADCWSDALGKAGGRQDISLGNDCMDYSVIIHELLHAVGFDHEHQRYDRDSYITINWQNVERDCYEDLQKASPQDQDLLGEPYDYFSIMHYDRQVCSTNGQDTIVAKQPGMTEVIGMGTDFSVADLRKVQKMYRCPASSYVAPQQPTAAGGPRPAVIDGHGQAAGAPQWPTAPAAPQWPTAPQVIPQLPLTQASSASGGCFDQSPSCSMWLTLCTNPGFATTLRQQCAKTCNFCTAAAPAPNPFAQWPGK